jgi:nucleoside phosphorylase
MDRVDVLIITALQEEFEAAKTAGTAAVAGGTGIAEWLTRDPDTSIPYSHGEYVCRDGRRLSIALARATRMSGRTIAPMATRLSAELKPTCLAMSGVCAGNPGSVAMGDVIVAEMTYEYDEGKLTTDGFVGDHRQYRLDDRWIRAAQDFDPAGLPSYGRATEDEAMIWFLERLLIGQEPRSHPGRARYFPTGQWAPGLESIETKGYIARDATGWVLTERGRSYIGRVRYDDVDGPERLPFAVVVGPVASGNVVAKDGTSWERLKAMGVRTVAGLEMEAATIATVADAEAVPHWLVVKGVMDHADPNKDDRYKGFAARASAEVLFALLDRLVAPAGRPAVAPTRPAAPPGPLTASFENVRGLQIGDHNVQTNVWND